MKKITLLFLLSFPFMCFSQTPDWLWSRNEILASNDGRQYTAVDNAGNIYLVGDFGSAALTVGATTLTNTGAGFWDIYVIKYDKDGNVLWAKNFGGTNHDAATAIATDSQGNFYITGTYQYSIAIGSTVLANADTSSFFAKFDPNGNALWAKTQTENTSNWIAGDMTVDASGNVYLAGQYGMATLTFGSVSVTNENFIDANYKHAWVGKFDGNGNCIWLRAAQSAANNTFGSMANNVRVDSSGNVYIAGRFSNNSINFGTVAFTKTASYDYNSNMFIVKYDSDGVAQWGKNTGTIYENLTMANSLATDADNNVFVSGFFSNDIHFDGITLTAFGGGSKPFTAKFDTNGTTLWARSPIGGACAGMNQNSDTDSAGNLYVTGFTSCSSVNFGNGVNLAMSGEGGLYVVKYNAAGNAVWARRSSETNINNQASIDVVTENEIYVAGTFWSPTLAFGSTPPLTKAETNYNVFLAKLYYAPLAAQAFSAESFSVSPNPMGNAFFVTGLPGNCSYSIYDISGKQVLDGFFNGESDFVETSGIASGMYLLQVRDTNGASAVKKIVKL